MRTLLTVIAVLLLLAGGTFFLQGINILPGSFMTGDPQWAINGAVMVVVALGLAIWANRRRNFFCGVWKTNRWTSPIYGRT